MTVALKNYLREIEKNDKGHAFWLWRFYLKPAISLSDYFDKNNGSYNYFILNKNFLIFLKLCLKDDSFISKLNDKDLSEIRFFLFENKDILNDSILYDGRRDYKKDILSKSYFSNIVHKVNYRRDYLNLLNYLIRRITFLEEEYCNRYILPKLEKEKIFKRIIYDNYQDIFDCFLFERHGKDALSFQNLVCDNQFLDIIYNYLLDYDLPSIIIENIIEILEMGVDFKKFNTSNSNFWKCYHLLGGEKVRDFRYKDAVNLISLLRKKKKNIKVVSLEEKKRIRSIYC